MRFFMEVTDYDATKPLDAGAGRFRVMDDFAGPGRPGPGRRGRWVKPRCF